MDFKNEIEFVRKMAIPFILILMMYEFIAQFYTDMPILGQVAAMCAVGVLAVVLMRRRRKH